MKSLTITFVLLLQIVAFAQKPNLLEYERVSMVRLIADPCAFEGKKIQTVGYLILEFEDNALYVHKEDYDHWFGNSIWVNTSKDMMNKRDKLSGRYVILAGKFTCKEHGHMGLFDGELSEIVRADFWSDPAHSNAAKYEEERRRFEENIKKGEKTEANPK